MKMFGKKAKDIVTGFTGTIIGYVQYSTGCNQILLVPKVSKDGAFRESCWFDEQRISILPGLAIKLNNGTANGPDLAAPVK